MLCGSKQHYKGDMSVHTPSPSGTFLETNRSLEVAGVFYLLLHGFVRDIDNVCSEASGNYNFVTTYNKSVDIS